MEFDADPDAQKDERELNCRAERLTVIPQRKEDPAQERL
jgi:hypothetical protein